MKGKSVGILCFPRCLVRNGGGDRCKNSSQKLDFLELTVVAYGTGLTAEGWLGECFLCQMGFARYKFPLVTSCHEIMDSVPYHWEVVGGIVTICDFCFFRYFFFFVKLTLAKSVKSMEYSVRLLFHFNLLFSVRTN